MVDIKDFVFDRFGIMDDAGDFADRLQRTQRDFTAKATVAKRLLSDMERVVRSAKTPSELKQANAREAMGVVKDLRDGMKDLLQDAHKLERKARKEPKIWAVLEKPLADATNGMGRFSDKMQDTMRQLVLLEREQKEVLKSLAKQEAETGKKRTNTLSRRLGRAVGIVAAALTIVGAISLTVAK